LDEVVKKKEFERPNHRLNPDFYPK